MRHRDARSPHVAQRWLSDFVYLLACSEARQDMHRSNALLTHESCSRRDQLFYCKFTRVSAVMFNFVGLATRLCPTDIASRICRQSCTIAYGTHARGTLRVHNFDGHWPESHEAVCNECNVNCNCRYRRISHRAPLCTHIVRDVAFGPTVQNSLRLRLLLKVLNPLPQRFYPQISGLANPSMLLGCARPITRS
jgi:hypothetical protein